MRYPTLRAMVGSTPLLLQMGLAVAVLAPPSLASAAGVVHQALPASARATRPDAPAVGAGEWLDAAIRGLQRSEYQFTADARGLAAPNREHGLRSYISTTGVEIVSRNAQDPGFHLSLVATGVGRGEVLRPLASGRVSAREERAEIARNDLTEWFINDSRGLEHGFSLPARLPGDSGPLIIELVVTGSLSAAPETARSVLFRNAGGQPVLRYGGLVANDATGRVLPARLAVEPGALRIEVDDEAAVYPVTIDPLLASATWSATGNQAGAQFGFAVATAGDVNSDGFSDVIIGAPLFDAGLVDAGRAFVFLGSATGLASTPSWTADGPQAGAQFGSSVASAGDVNGDGFDDVIAGAPSFDGALRSDEGSADLFLGSPAGPGATRSWTATGGQTGARLGSSVASAGDVNGDGLADVIVGAPLFDNASTDEGRALAFLGSPSGLSTAPYWTADGGQADSQFGQSVAAAGDVDADGYTDIIVGAPLFDGALTDEGRAFVFHGSASGWAAAPSWVGAGGQANAHFGASVAAAGDIDGDGYSDVIVGAPLFDNTLADEGRALVYRGSVAGTVTAALWTAHGGQAGAHLGESVASAGDVNGDGYADVITGAPLFDATAADDGRVFVYQGSAAGPAAAPVWAADGGQLNAHLGGAVAGAGDFNGDGYGDVVAGSALFDGAQTDEGRAVAYLGCSAGPASAAAWTATGAQTSVSFGYWVAGAGDVNGDGYGDVIVGAPFYDGSATDEGSAYVYLGSAAGLSTTPAWSASGGQQSAQFGFRVATAGDVNGDGYSDIIIGAWLYSTTSTNVGKAYVYHGSALGLSPTPSWTATGTRGGSRLGSAVATAGDVNGDGYSDVIVGQYTYTVTQSEEGRALVYLGSPSGLAASPSWSASPGVAVAHFGWSASTAGDVNGDGYSDIIVGAPRFNNGKPDEGRAWVYLGSPAGLSPVAAWWAESDQADARFGYGVATAGDVNGDGYSDIIVGAHYFTDTLTKQGAAFVFYGSPSGPAAGPTWSVKGNQTAGDFGYSVAGASDVNGDGYDDVIVGADFYNSVPGLQDDGGAFVYLGSASGLAVAPVWSGVGGQRNAQYGTCVASAGDVNGDGFGDIIVGARWLDDSFTDEGKSYVYYGGGGAGLTRRPQQKLAGADVPIGLLCRSDAGESMRLQSWARTAAGRGKVRLEWEVKPQGTAFDGTGLARAPWIDSGAPGTGGSCVNGFATVAGLTGNTSYRWRLRTVSNDPLFPRSPWLSHPERYRASYELRTNQPGCTPGPDLCDGIDSDCDGSSEEDFVPSATYCGVGACAASGATSCVGGQIVDGCTPATPVPEVCDAVDNDCDGTVDDVPTPGDVFGLTVSFASGATTVGWSPTFAASTYDVARGNLPTLLSSHGDFGLATQACLADGTSQQSVIDVSAPPASGDGHWYLTRADSCGGPGSYDDGAPGQVSSRDAGIAASPQACP